ncbi:MAG: hypothetical protein SWO11_12585 [Thermodesulfobacteriota bacterium]|nr:hypothetical protein [Thermodesulfobacteriota bacterium]
MTNKKAISTQVFFIVLVLCVLTGISGCGKKGFPVAPDTSTPMAVNDLSTIAGEEAITLYWTIPERNTDGSKLTDLTGCKVLRSTAKSDNSDCPDCPKKFKRLADIELRGKPYKQAILKDGIMEYVDKDLTARSTYTYKVLSYNLDGIFSKDSNLVEIKWQMPAYH